MKRTADTKNRVPETANTGSIASASNFLGRLLNDFQTRLILLIIAILLRGS